jgi:hypothetical protein
MMDPMTAMLVGALAPTMLLLAKALRVWVVLRGRAQLVRATARLSAGAHVRGSDTAGLWSARRNRESAQ